MSAIRSFIELVIYVAIVAIIIELIMPKGNTKKYVYIILSLFILLNIVSPVINIIRDADMQGIFDNVLETMSTNTEYAGRNNIVEFSEYKNIKVTEDLEKDMLKDIKMNLSSLNVDFKDLDILLDEDLAFEELKVQIGNLDHLGDKKIQKISDIIEMISKEYNISENSIRIIEEGNDELR